MSTSTPTAGQAKAPVPPGFMQTGEQVTLTPSATFSSAAASIATIRLHNDAISAIMNQLPLLQTLAHADAAQAQALLTAVPVLQSAAAEEPPAAGATPPGAASAAEAPAPAPAQADTPARSSSASASSSSTLASCSSGSDAQADGSAQGGSTNAPKGTSLERLSLEHARAIPLGSLPVLDSQGNVLAAYDVTAGDGSGAQPSLEDLSAVVQHAVNAGTVLSLPPVHMDELPGEVPEHGPRAAASAAGAASTSESLSRATSVASSSQASRNRRASAAGPSGPGRGDADPFEKRKSKYIGVSYYPRRKKWKAQISLNRRNHFLGYYPTEDIAGAVVAKAKELKEADWAVQHIIQGVKDYYKTELSAAPARPAHPAAVPAGAGNKRSRDDGVSAAMGTPIIAGAGLISGPPTSA